MPPALSPNPCFPPFPEAFFARLLPFPPPSVSARWHSLSNTLPFIYALDLVDLASAAAWVIVCFAALINLLTSRRYLMDPWWHLALLGAVAGTYNWARQPWKEREMREQGVGERPK